MRFERKVRKSGTESTMLIIPKDLVKHLDLDFDDDVIIENETGKHGNYISVWKKNQVSPNDS